MRVVAMPFIDLAEMTIQAISDVASQRGEKSYILAIDNGSSLEEGKKVKAAFSDPSTHYTRHAPPLPTLNATWNWAAGMAQQLGTDRVFILNNDIRLEENTFDRLERAMEKHDALFVSAVGRKELQQDSFKEEQLDQKGGPDYSCFLMSLECWEKYPFDPQFTWFGDNDHHRRIWLAGEGSRIFSVNLPYIHLGSQTINRSEAAREKGRKVFDSHKRRYINKWAGEPHHEQYIQPFGSPDAEVFYEGVETPGGYLDAPLPF